MIGRIKIRFTSLRLFAANLNLFYCLVTKSLWVVEAGFGPVLRNDTGVELVFRSRRGAASKMQKSMISGVSIEQLNKIRYRHFRVA